MKHYSTRITFLSLAIGMTTLAALYARPGSAAPPAKPASQEIRPVSLDQIADWETFICEFRRAVARRDRSALKQVMPKTFIFSLEDEYEGDVRDAAFRKWDDSRVKGWQALDRVLARGTCQDPEVPGLMVCPPEWITDHRRYVDYRAGFDRRGGYWRWVWFLDGE